MTVNITIIGLGRIGASIGLALAAHKDQVTVTGHDKTPTVAQAAKKLGAVDKVAFNLPASIEEADVVVLSLPLDQIYNTLKIIAQDIREDAVVFDTAPVKSAAATWVKELLPPGRHYVGLIPAINPQYLEESARGVDSARADLFQHSLVAVTAPPGTAEAAMKLASDFVTLLGASPFYADLAEVDGILACAHLLPQLTAAALMESALNQPGWSDIRKLAGPAFAAGTSLLAAEEPGALAEAANQNQQNIVRVLDEAIATLSGLREEIATGKKTGLEKKLQLARKGREKWQAERAKDDWLAVDFGRPEMPSSRDILKQQIGGLDKLFRRGGKKTDEESDADERG